MLILRLIGVLALLTIAAAFALFLYTRNRRYLNWAWRVFQFALVFVIVLMVLFLLERLVYVV
jgi:hypothetical protein